MIPPWLIEAGAEFWRRNHIGKLLLAARPIHRLKERRKAKRAARRREAEGAATEAQFQFDDEGTSMNDWQQSLLRSILKVAGTAAVTHGLIEAGQTDVLVTALEAIAGGLITVVGLYLSHRKHKA